MNLKEIENAIEIIKKYHPFATKYQTDEECIALQTALNVMQSVLNAKCPEGHRVGYYVSSGKEMVRCDKCNWEELRTISDCPYNQAVKEMRLWQAKCLARIKEGICDYEIPMNNETADQL